MAKWANNEEIQIFREYLQIPSVHPDIDYSKKQPPHKRNFFIF